MNPHDPVNHPKHYTQHPSGVECITVTEHMNFCLGNAMKYIWRAGEKGDAIEDLKKARWYLDREIQRREKPKMPVVGIPIHTRKEDPHFRDDYVKGFQPWHPCDGPEPPHDPTRRELPLPEGLPGLPSLPDGKTRWVYRGRFPDESYPVEPDRIVKYFYHDSGLWGATENFSEDLHHIEAI